MVAFDSVKSSISGLIGIVSRFIATEVETSDESGSSFDFVESAISGLYLP